MKKKERERDREESSATYTQCHLNICRSLFININIAFFYIFTATISFAINICINFYMTKEQKSVCRIAAGRKAVRCYENPLTWAPPFQMAMKIFTFENRFSIFDLDEFQFFACHFQSPNRPNHGRAGLEKTALLSTLLSCRVRVIRLCSVACVLYEFPFHDCNNIVNAMLVYYIFVIRNKLICICLTVAYFGTEWTFSFTWQFGSFICYCTSSSDETRLLSFMKQRSIQALRLIRLSICCLLLVRFIYLRTGISFVVVLFSSYISMPYA